MTAATEILSPQGASSATVRSRGSGTDIIPPRPARALRAWLRRATIRAASSRERAPATQAAAISPCEWPTTAAGSTPYERQTAARATMTANSVGWTMSTRSKEEEEEEPGSAGCSPRTSSRDQSV